MTSALNSRRTRAAPRRAWRCGSSWSGPRWSRPCPPDAAYVRLTDRDEVVFRIGDFAFHPEHRLAFEENDRVVIANSGLEKSFRIVRVRRSNHFQTWEGRVNAFGRRVVGRGELAGCAVGTAKYDRHIVSTTRHVAASWLHELMI